MTSFLRPWLGSVVAGILCGWLWNLRKPAADSALPDEPAVSTLAAPAVDHRRVGVACEPDAETTSFDDFEREVVERENALRLERQRFVAELGEPLDAPNGWDAARDAAQLEAVADLLDVADPHIDCSLFPCVMILNFFEYVSLSELQLEDRHGVSDVAQQGSAIRVPWKPNRQHSYSRFAVVVSESLKDLTDPQNRWVGTLAQNALNRPWSRGEEEVRDYVEGQRPVADVENADDP